MRGPVLAKVYQRTNLNVYCAIVELNLFGDGNIVTLKSGLGVTQSHWNGTI